jgi:hypothetical protein
VQHGCKKYASTLFHAPARRKERQIERSRKGNPDRADIDLAERFGDGGDRLPEKQSARSGWPRNIERKLRNFCGPQIVGEALTAFRPWAAMVFAPQSRIRRMADKQLAQLFFIVFTESRLSSQRRWRVPSLPGLATRGARVETRQSVAKVHRLSDT